jgi:hypothetical protein
VALSTVLSALVVGLLPQDLPTTVVVGMLPQDMPTTVVVGLLTQTLPSDVGVEVIARPGVPFVSASLAMPRGDVDVTHLPVLAALLSGNRAFPDGPVAELRLSGGTLVANATHDGLVVTADGPRELRSLVVDALAATLEPLVVDSRVLVDAQARVLRARGDARVTAAERARSLAFATLSGVVVDLEAPRVDDIALHRLTPDELAMSLARLQRMPGRTLVVEGSTEGLIEARKAAASAPEAVIARPLPLATSPEIVSVSATPRVLLAWPVPGALLVDDERRLTFCAALEDALQSLGPTEVRVVGSASQAMAVVEITTPGAPADVGLAARARLGTFRDTVDARLAARAQKRAADTLARARAPLGASAQARARALLTTTEPLVVDPDFVWARALVVPEAMLAVTVSPNTRAPPAP